MTVSRGRALSLRMNKAGPLIHWIRSPACLRVNGEKNGRSGRALLSGAGVRVCLGEGRRYKDRPI